MRLTTFPGKVNGVTENFKFGFGIAAAGISNIARYHRTGNIPGWVHRVCQEDPATNPSKWEARSPDQLTAHAHGPILVIHGSNDSRVPVEESRSFVRNMKASGKPVEYVEFEGEGHGFFEIANRVKQFEVQLDFISKILADSPVKT
jgi:dipeptidyl aminopeptidase/acylaminoacyl peptidase